MQRTRWIAALGGLMTIAAFSQSPARGDDPEDPALQQRRRTPVVEVFEKARDAVVNVSATQFIQRRGWTEIDDLFDRFFDRPDELIDPFDRRRTLRRSSMGSGFVLHEDGYIVSNAHVVAHTAERKVVFSDGREFDAEIVALDMKRDLAVLKIEADEPLETLPLGTSSDLMVGETVIAIGNPLGYQHTVTAGVVSAVDRTLQVTENMQFEGLIQTDASINPGNSGGPLLNVLGQLIGINTAIRADAQNIGFAIPVDQLRERLPELLSIERRYRVTTGLVLRNGSDGGVVVEDVGADSAAEQAGLREGDIVAAIGNQAAANLVDYHIALLGRRPGDRVDLKVRRGDSIFLTTLELRERPPADGIALAQKRLGVSLEELSAAAVRELGFRARSMLRVVSIEPASPADAIDMKPGDFLIELNGRFPASADEVGELLEEIASGDMVRLGFLRGTPRRSAQWVVNVKVR